LTSAEPDGAVVAEFQPLLTPVPAGLYRCAGQSDARFSSGLGGSCFFACAPRLRREVPPQRASDPTPDWNWQQQTFRQPDQRVLLSALALIALNSASVIVPLSSSFLAVSISPAGPPWPAASRTYWSNCACAA
jgi:hypothetical protein